MSYLVLARKWRPKLFSEVVGQDHAVQALKNSIVDEKVNQAYIFNGTRGVGKTSIARILTKALNCEKHINGEPCGKCDHCLAMNENSSIDFQEIDAASRRSREETMNLLETVPYLPASSKYKVYLIDEVHMLTKESFNALLKTLEEPPPHVIFMFATTEIDKVPATILSRCLQLNLRLLSEEEIVKQLSEIFKEEKISFDDESLKIISKSASGSMRDALTISEKVISYCNGKLKKEDVQTLLGIPSEEKVFALLDILKDRDSKGLYEFFENNLSLNACVVKASGGYEILPANSNLIATEKIIEQTNYREKYFSKHLKKDTKKYDYILFDCPPSLNLLTINAMEYCKKVLVPVQCEYYALEGLVTLKSTIDQLNAALGLKIEIVAILRTMADWRNRLTREVSDQLEKHFKKTVLNTIIPRNVRLAEAPSYGQSIVDYDIKSIGAEAFFSLSGEFIRKFENGKKNISK